MRVSWTNIRYYYRVFIPETLRELILLCFLIILLPLLISTVNIVWLGQLKPASLTILLGVSLSAMATITIEIMNSFAKKLELTQKKNFGNLFCCLTKRSKPLDISLVIAEFSGELKQENNIRDLRLNTIPLIWLLLKKYNCMAGILFLRKSLTRKSKTLKQITNIDLAREPQKLFIRSDVIAASHIISAFSSMGFDIPTIKGDTKIFEDIQNPLLSKETESFLSLGLFSNGILSSILDEEGEENDDSRYFHLERSITDVNKIKYAQFDPEQPTSLLSKEIRNWRDFTVRWDSKKREIKSDQPKGEKFDYGLFAKFYYKKQRFIVCGAVTELGTNSFAKYVASNWEDIYFLLSQKKESPLEEKDPFALIYKLPVVDNRINPKDIQLEISCIKRWSNEDGGQI